MGVGHMEDIKTRDKETSSETFNKPREKHRWFEFFSDLPHHLGTEWRRLGCRMWNTRGKKQVQDVPWFPACTVTWRVPTNKAQTSKATQRRLVCAVRGTGSVPFALMVQGLCCC